MSFACTSSLATANATWCGVPAPNVQMPCWRVGIVLEDHRLARPAALDVVAVYLPSVADFSKPSPIVEIVVLPLELAHDS